MTRCQCGRRLEGDHALCSACRRRSGEIDALIASRYPPSSTPLLPYRRRRRKAPSKKDLKP